MLSGPDYSNLEEKNRKISNTSSVLFSNQIDELKVANQTASPLHRRVSISSSVSSIYRNKLLESQEYEEDIEESEIERYGKCSRIVPTEGFCNEVKGTWRLSWVLIIITFSNYAMQPVSMMFGGHLGKLELDALALANSFINILGWATLTGFGTVCDTLFAQTFGSQNYKLMGIYLQRCLILHVLLVIILIPIFANMGAILLHSGQDPEVSELTGYYLLLFTPSLLAMSVYFVMREYIYTQDVIYPDLFISISGFVIHICLQYFFIQVFGWGLTGSVIGQLIVNTYMALSTVLYFLLSGLYKKTWTPWSWVCIQDWWMITRLGLYGLCLTCFEWWAFEVTIFLSGILGKDQLAAQSIVFNIDMILYSIASALGIAVAIRVGWHLGANRPKSAITASTAGMVMAGLAAVFIVIITLTLSNQLPQMFTNDPDIVALAASLIPFIAAYTFFDSICGIGRAVLRGTGMQKLGTVYVIIIYYIIALPIGLPLMFLTKYELYGIWSAFVLALVLGAIATIVLIYFYFDWNDLAYQAQVRTGNVEQSKEHLKYLKSDLQNEDEKANLLITDAENYQSMENRFKPEIKDSGVLTPHDHFYDKTPPKEEYRLKSVAHSFTIEEGVTFKEKLFKFSLVVILVVIMIAGIIVKVTVTVDYSPPVTMFASTVSYNNQTSFLHK